MKRTNWEKAALSMIACLALVFALLPATVRAADNLSFVIDTGEIITLQDTDSDGAYEIGTADALYAFAAAVNSGQTSINGKLTADIVVNPGDVAGCNGTKAEGWRDWTPIGTNYTSAYAGTFDGGSYTISGLYFNDSTADYVGLFGYVKLGGQVQNVGVVNSYFSGKDFVGAIAGYNDGAVQNCYNTGTVTSNTRVGGVVGTNGSDGYICNCYNTGTVSGTQDVGGVVGLQYGGNICNCYNTGTVSGNTKVGGVVGHTAGFIRTSYNIGTVVGRGDVGGVVGYYDGRGIIDFCYYLTGCAKDINGNAQDGIGNSDDEGVTACADFSTGEVAYRLRVFDENSGGGFPRGDWGQDITTGEGDTETDDYPVLGGAKVYFGYLSCASDAEKVYTNDNRASNTKPGHTGGAATCTEKAACAVCGTKYGELNASNHASETYTNGFRDCCGEIESAVDSDGDGYYEISNAGQLYWFADKVNNDNANFDSANAVLTANIDVNPGYTFALDEYGALVVTKDGTTVTEGWRDWTPIGSNGNIYEGTFDGSNFTVSGLYFNDSDANEVGLFGYVNTSGTVQNLGVVNSYFSGKYFVGAIAGYDNGAVQNCYNTGTVTGNTSVGGVVGSQNYGNISNCYNTGTVSGNTEVGGVAGLQNDGNISNCYNTGAVSGIESVGGVVGTNSGNGNIYNCYNTGTVSSNNSDVGGVAGTNGGNICNCYNTGTVSGNIKVGGVVGRAAGYIRNSYNIGTVAGSGYVGGVVGEYGGTIDFCCYLTGCARDGDSVVQNGIGSPAPGSTAADVDAKTKGYSDFSTGEVAYWLRNHDDGAGGLLPSGNWGQTIGTDAYPVLGGRQVYYGYTSCDPADGMKYTSDSPVSATRPGHTSICSASGNVITASCSECETALGTATITANDAVYTGTAQETATVTYSNDWTGGVLTPAYANNTSAGSATASITLNGVTASVTFTIEKADAAFSAPEGIANLTYTGSAQELVTAGSTAHGTMQYSLDKASWSAAVPTATDAKSYTVWYKVLGDSNHKNSDPDSVSVTIGQMDLSGAAVTLGTALTYNGTAQTQSIASVTLNGLNLTAGDYTVTGNQQTGAGDYTLTITGKDNFTGTATAAWSIAKASVTITADNVTVLVGKDVPAEAALTYTVTGLVGGDTAESALSVKPVLSYSATPDTTQVGSYTIAISGAAADNYDITHVDGTLTVSEKTPVTITVNLPANLVYNAADLTSSITANITAVVTDTGDAAAISAYDYAFSASPINAGSYTLTVSVAGSDAQYAGSVTIPFTIAQRPLTLKADNKTALVNGSEPEYTVTATGLMSGHSVSGASADCAGADMTTAGTYDITVSAAGLVITDGVTDVTANYAVTTENGTLTVSTPYTPPVVPVPAPTVTVPVSGDNTRVQVEVSVTGEKATVGNVKLEALETVVDGRGKTVTIDFSALTQGITAVELPVSVVETIAEAAAAKHMLEIVFSDHVSIAFDASALHKQVQHIRGTTITISILSRNDARLTPAQQAAVGDRPAYDVSLTSGGRVISGMGDRITVTVPYELRNGEKADGLVVCYVDKNGGRERCDTRYDAKNKRLSWQTDHLSIYMIDYDETLAETCDGGTDCPLNAFTDLKSTAWYHDGVHFCIESDLMNGVSDALFVPDGTTTRAQIVTILWRLEGEPVVNYLMQFDDVAADKWYTEAVRWAAAGNIVGGYGDGKFGPGDAITREQMAAILYRYCRYKGIDVSVGEDTNILSYTDAFDIREYAIPAMQWACGSGVISGIADGDDMKLDPCGSAKRAQVATILWRFCENVLNG